MNLHWNPLTSGLSCHTEVTLEHPHFIYPWKGITINTEHNKFDHIVIFQNFDRIFEYLEILPIKIKKKTMT